MEKFITVRCEKCKTVIYNLPEAVAHRFRDMNILCEDCVALSTFKYHTIDANQFVYSMR